MKKLDPSSLVIDLCLKWIDTNIIKNEINAYVDNNIHTHHINLPTFLFTNTYVVELVMTIFLQLTIIIIEM